MFHDCIKETKISAFSEDRKNRHLASFANQLQKTQFTRATSWYNAAVIFYNAGYLDKAKQLAKKTASHPAFKEKAENFLELMKK